MGCHIDEKGQGSLRERDGVTLLSTVPSNLMGHDVNIPMAIDQ